MTEAAKPCDHKFVGSNACAKCGISVDDLRKQNEEAAVMGLVFQLVSDIGAQLTAAGYPPPVLWYVMACASKTVELGLENTVRLQPDVAPMLDAARARVAELLASCERDARKGFENAQH